MQITLDHETATLLTQLADGWNAEHPDDPRTPTSLVNEAVVRVHRGFYGLPDGDPKGPQQSTGPFRKYASDRRAEVLLRQIDPNRFRLSQPIRFDDGTERLEIEEEYVSDLASVPEFLTWLVPRYGWHTLAALLHDSLQTRPDRPDYPPERADAHFRDAMGATNVPLLRRWLMWAAVAIRTEVKFMSVPRKVRAVGWVGACALGSLALWGWSAWRFADDPGLETLGTVGALTAGAVVVPVVLSPVLWGKRWKMGALSGVALVFVTVPVVLVNGSKLVYLGFDWLAEHLFVRPADRNPVVVPKAGVDR
jgi:hypothetical protein